MQEENLANSNKGKDLQAFNFESPDQKRLMQPNSNLNNITNNINTNTNNLN